MRKQLMCLIHGKKGKKSAGDAFFDNYQVKLKRARALAFITNLMYSLNWFLGFCALTWASAVILGGLLTVLSQHDYFSVVALLVLEAVRLSAATFFGKLMIWRFVHSSADPQRLTYNDSATQKFQGIAHILDQAFQLTVIAVSILVPIRRLQDLRILSSSLSITVVEFDGMKTSLCIFYVLVLINGAIAIFALMFSKNLVPFFVNSACLRKYYEKVVCKGIYEGLLNAADFELLSWTFQMQADEYRRNTRAWVVKELYRDMMKFLYYHPKNKGFEAAKVALESDDTYEREAAANIVGLWVGLAEEVEKSNALARLVMQKKLLAKLAEALDNDESGRAASVSFMSLVERDPEGMLRVRSEGGNEMLADILMDRIHEAVESRKPKKALIDIKAMIPLLSYLMMARINGSHKLDKYCTWDKLEVLKEDMWIVVTEYASDLKRLQTVAAYTYNLLMTDEERKTRDLCIHLRVEPKDRGSYILEDEINYALELMKATGMPSEWKDAVSIRKLEVIKRLPWLARRSTAMVASFVNLAMLVVSSIFIMRFAHY